MQNLADQWVYKDNSYIVECDKCTEIWFAGE